jgi:hypothetical protein
MKNIILLSCLVAMLFSCEQKLQQKKKARHQFSKNIQFDSIDLNLVSLSKFNTSFVGNFHINEEYIAFLDKKYGKIFHFNAKGELLDEYLGRGNSPFEINTAYIDGYLPLKNGNHLFLGSSFDLHFHSGDNFERIKSVFLKWEGEQDIEKVRSSSEPDVTQFALYTLDYQNLLLREGENGQIYIPIYGETQYFNGLNSDFYYKEGKILARMDVEAGKITEVIGNRSLRYLENKYLPHHASFSYDIDSLYNFYISHEIDSLIYKYNQDYELISAFGVKGSEMNTNYTEIKDFEPKLFKKLYFNERPKLGWYSHIEFIDELGLLFRSYKKGEHSEFDGLQIFKNETLIADLKVPKGFIVKGYIKPYVFGEVISENSETLNLYKFKLE